MIANFLKVGMGRRQCDKVVALVVEQPELLAELFRLLTNGTREQRMKGSWVWTGVHEVSPALVNSYYSDMLKHLNSEIIGGVKRQLLKCFLEANLNTDQASKLLSITMQWVTDHEQDLAVRYVCFKILKKQLKELPELRLELEHSISLYRDKFGRFP